MKEFKKINEALATKEVDPKRFPNPHPKDKNFTVKGRKDGEKGDDIVETKPVSIPAKSLKPSQDAVYLGKALGLAINGVEGGDLGAVISKDNRILDGHHRWAATIFNNPSAKVQGVQSDLSIGDLIPVLRAAGDAMGNKRGLPPKGGDVNIFQATIQDVEDAIYNGKHMNPEFYNKEKSIEWYEAIGRDTVQKALKLLQRVGPPAGAPPRADMPKIEPEQVKDVAKNLNAGGIDVRPPYIQERFDKLPTFEEFLNESVNEAKNEIKFKGKKVDVSSLEVDDVDPKDYPEFTDAYFSYGEWSNGKEMTDKELEEFQDDNLDLLNDLAHEKYR